MSNGRESLVSENTFTVTHGPDVIAGSSGNGRQFFSAQAAVSLHRNDIPGATVPAHCQRRSRRDANCPDVVSGYRGNAEELIGSAGNIRTRHLAPTSPIPMKNESFDRCICPGTTAVSDCPDVIN
jgi:hypothetical protein